MPLPIRTINLSTGLPTGLRASLSLLMSAQCLLFSSPANARPMSQDPLGVYPKNTVAFTTVNFEPLEILKGIQGLPLDMREEFQKTLQEVVFNANKSGNGSVLKALQSISGHVSMAYRSAPEGVGEILFQIETQNKNALQQMMTSLKDNSTLKTNAFSNTTIYAMPLSEVAGPELNTQNVFMAQQGKYIRGTIGETDRGLKEMLYLRRVHSPNSPWRLSGQKDVQRAKQALSPKGEQWSYIRSEQAKEALIQYLPGLTPTKNPPELKGPWLQDAVNFAEGMGVNLSVSTQTTPKVTIKAYTQHRPSDLSDFQKEYIYEQETLQSLSFAPLLGHFKAPLTALMAWHFNGLEDFNTIPSEHELPEALNELSGEIGTDALVKEIQKEIQKHTGLHYASDIEPFVSGPIAWGLLPLTHPKQRLHNDMGMVIEVKKGAGNFAVHLAHKLEAKKLSEINDTPVYKIDLSKIEQDIAMIGELFPGLAVSEQGPPALFFAQQSAHPYLLVSNHLNALIDMLNTSNAKHPYFKARASSQSHIYLNTQQFFEQASEEIADVKEIKAYASQFYATQQESLGATTNTFEIIATGKAKPWLKITENIPLPFALLSAIALPNFIDAQERARTSYTKANMHTLQTLVETYAIDWGGVYPPSLAALEQEAKAGSYWRDIENPYNKSSKKNHPAYASINNYDKSIPGQVVLDLSQPLLYRIYGTGKYGDFIKDREKYFLLSNY